MWLWGVVGLATVAGLYAYQHRKDMPSMLAHAGAVAGMPHMARDAPVPAAKPQIKTAAITPEPRAESSLPVPPAAIPVAMPVNKIPVERPIPACEPSPAAASCFAAPARGPIASLTAILSGRTASESSWPISTSRMPVPRAAPAKSSEAWPQSFASRPFSTMEISCFPAATAATTRMAASCALPCAQGARSGTRWCRKASHAAGPARRRPGVADFQKFDWEFKEINGRGDWTRTSDPLTPSLKICVL